jgi:hypothetical protein
MYGKIKSEYSVGAHIRVTFTCLRRECKCKQLVRSLGDYE